jgi:hypothetical protein
MHLGDSAAQCNWWCGLTSGISEMPGISGINELTYGSNGMPATILNEKMVFYHQFLLD